MIMMTPLGWAGWGNTDAHVLWQDTPARRRPTQVARSVVTSVTSIAGRAHSNILPKEGHFLMGGSHE